MTEAEPDAFDRVMRVNARGPWLSMRAWVGAMREQGTPGSFVAVSSVSARLVDRAMGLYCASKAALSLLVQVAAAEWGEFGIRVNAVAPGVTRTRCSAGPRPRWRDSPWLAGVAGRTALGRLGEAGDIAQSIIALHTMEWVTGQVLECDGGLSLHSPIIPCNEPIALHASNPPRYFGISPPAAHTRLVRRVNALPTPVQLYERFEVLLLYLGELHELRPHQQFLVRGFSTMSDLDLELNGQG